MLHLTERIQSFDAAASSAGYQRSYTYSGQRSGANRTARAPRLQLPSGVTLGLRTGDLVSFSIFWPTLSDAEPLNVWAIVLRKQLATSDDEVQNGATPYHKM